MSLSTTADAAASNGGSTAAIAGLHVLVTGGAGYIGSHTVLALLQSGARVTVIDNLVNSSRESLERVAQLAGGNSAAFVKVDLLDVAGLAAVFEQNKFDACIHFAGLKVRTMGRSDSGSG